MWARLQPSILGIVLSISVASCGSIPPNIPVMIITPAVADGTIGVPYDQAINATGGTGPFSWALSAGALPAGLHLVDSSTANLTISGLPVTSEAPISFTIAVSDSRGSSATQAYKITIAAMTTARTKSGQVQGVIEGDLVAFRGIPYAAAPTGNLRWRPPTPAVAWTGIRDASKFGSVCPQLINGHVVIGDEDCLTLNVFESTSPGNWQQPVMVYFHGGGNNSGSAQQAPLDAPPLAKHGVIVITAQYRLGMLGFFANQLLSAEGGGSSGNYALWDQLAALQWVKDNISNFGGDPNRVTIFGESSGAYDVYTLMFSPLAQGLFSRAVLESNNALNGGGVQQLSILENSEAGYISTLGCDSASDVLACMRAIPMQTVVSEQVKTFGWGPAIEPLVVPVDPITILHKSGTPVPLLLGSNREESTYWGDYTQPLITSSTYETNVQTRYGSKILALYPESDYESPNYALIAVDSDYQISCQVRGLALAAAENQEAKIWRYLFTHRFENNAALNAMAAYHTSELFFVFGNLQLITTVNLSVPYVPSLAEQALSEQMMNYWTRFAATGDPNGEGETEWPQSEATNESLLQIDDSNSIMVGYHAAPCNLFQQLPTPFKLDAIGSDFE